MKQNIVGAILVICVAGMTGGVTAAEFKAYWKDTFHFDSEDGAFKLVFGGRLMEDFAWFSADDAIKDKYIDGTEFRWARINFDGTIFERVEFKVDYDFAGGDANFKDVYMGVTQIPMIGGIWVGHIKEGFGFEVLSSGKNISFLERACITAFSPGRNSGIRLANTIKSRLYYEVGFYREADNFGKSENENSTGVTARVAGVPWQIDKDRLVHLGVSYSIRGVDESIRFRDRPESHLAPVLIDTGNMSADGAGLLNIETIFQYKSFYLASEWTRASVDSELYNDPEFSGYYVEATYFLTGESKNYKGPGQYLGRLKPKSNFLNGGPGAWELAARYTTVDLNDGDVTGGEMADVTVGLNWYLNPNSRIMLNYVNSDLDNVGKTNIVMLRFQIDF